MISNTQNNSNPIITPRLKIFSDFDGTIAIKDVGDAFFETFGGKIIWDDIKLYEQGAIGAKELFLREASRIKNISAEAIDEFCEKYVIDLTYVSFLDWCSENNFDIYIISDGMDVYVNPILSRYKITVPVFCNRMIINQDGTVKIEFPYDDEESQDCANCKRNHLLTKSSDEDIIVMIGDGYSDRCPARYADIVFAKGSLETYCQNENISYTMFSSFADIQKKLALILSKKRIRRPKQAQLRRRAIWMKG